MYLHAHAAWKVELNKKPKKWPSDPRAVSLTEDQFTGMTEHDVTINDDDKIQYNRRYSRRIEMALGSEGHFLRWI